jgi:carboxypeptidase family protein/Big-like domain-containing protein
VQLKKAAFSALSVLSALSCARMEPPPGGPPDPAPPHLIATRPDSLAVLRNFRGVAEFQFDEVISEGGTANRGEGTGGLEKLIILSPSTRVPAVSWKRSRITVRPSEGWRSNRVYRIELLPGVTDLRNNRSDRGKVLTFTTGAPTPTNTLQGQVIDWSSGRPAPNALVVATLLPDSLPYRGVADSSGRFSLGPLPNGDYLVTGVLDENHDQRQESREAYASGRTAKPNADVGELWTFVYDTTPPRIQNIAVNDSVSATVTFSQKLDPGQRLTARDVRLRLLPDSVPVAVASILPGPIDDSLHRRTSGPDSTASIDSMTPDTARGRRPRKPAPRLPERPATPLRAPTRPPLYDRLVLRVPRPWAAGSRMVLEVRGVKNITGVAGSPVGVAAVPENKPETPPSDSLRRSGRRDSTPPRPAGRTTPAPPPPRR